MKFTKTLFVFLALVVFASCDKDDSPVDQEVSDPDKDLKEGLVAYYPFNGNTNDVSGNNLNGAIVGNISYSDNKYFESNKSIEFGAGDSYVRVADDPKLQLKSAMTIYLEFMPETNAAACLVGKRDIGPGSQSFNFAINYSGPIVFDVIKKDKCSPSNIASDWSYCRTNTDAEIMAHCWNYAAAVFDGTSQKIYLNGQLVANLGIGFGEMGGCTANDLRLGYWWNSDKIPFKGKMDEVRIYNRALTADQISRLYKL